MTDTNKQNLACSIPSMSSSKTVKLGHGSGGKMTQKLIDAVFRKYLQNDQLAMQEDAALINLSALARPTDMARLAFTTDAYVVSPICFPGGNIGSLSVHGTVNDLAMRAARPLAISAAFILEEGFCLDELEVVLASMAEAAAQANVSIVAADTKVVNKGSGDKIFITTTGIGEVLVDSPPSAAKAKVGDSIIVSGGLGCHGMSVMLARESLAISSELCSDSANLFPVVEALLSADFGDISKSWLHSMRDLTRGGLASAANEIAQSAKVGMLLDENKIPIDEAVYSACEFLGLDPLYVACEGRFMLIVDSRVSNQVLAVLQKFDICSDAAIVGEVRAKEPGKVLLKSGIGGHRILDKLSGEQLPRIC